MDSVLRLGSNLEGPDRQSLRAHQSQNFFHGSLGTGCVQRLRPSPGFSQARARVCASRMGEYVRGPCTSTGMGPECRVRSACCPHSFSQSVARISEKRTSDTSALAPLIRKHVSPNCPLMLTGRRRDQQRLQPSDSGSLRLFFSDEEC